MKKSLKIAILIVTLLISNNLFSQIYSGQIFIGLHGNATKLIGGDVDDSTVRVLGEFSCGYYLTRKIGVGIEAGYGFVTVRDKEQLLEIASHLITKENTPFTTSFIPISIFGRINLLEGYNWIPYLNTGVGVMMWNCKNTDTNTEISSNNNLIGNIGGGIEWEVSRTVGIDFGIKYQRIFNQHDDMSGESTSGLGRGDVQTGNLSAGFGITLRFGGSNDADHDGFDDKLDKCPLVPEDFDGFEDEDGCPEWDNDGDGLSDLVETNTGIYTNVDSTGTDPNVADTDMDGINDYEEIFEYKTNPLNIDTDADSLDDGVEINEYQTDPNSDDTDGDTLPDYDEIFILKTDPINADTDSDGFMDGDDECPIESETFNGFKDDDGCPDKKPEVIFEEKTPIILDGVNFKSASSELTENSKIVLNKVVTTLEHYKEMHLEISGHTDSSGSTELNNKLSKKRAEAVRYYLINQGIASTRLHAIGLGPYYPISSNDTLEGKALNRRIEFFRLK